MECQNCQDDVEELLKVKAGKRTLRVCESCADELRNNEEIADAAESAMQGMMEYKGRR